ncbi:MAG: hypothetical protein KatS3mg110_0877 [Pirellulaceae bacterium]|nr:MAG: hypothetical protein KatS3mg110_0877 [Pirellulaceae bacterium]
MECSRPFGSHATLSNASLSARVHPDAVLRIIQEGEVIACYPDDLPYPSVLILGFEGGKPLDVVVAQDPENRICIVVTVYKPDPKLWSDDFRTRR